MDCNNCGSEEFEEVLSTSYDGHKGNRNRDDTEKIVFECEGCGQEGRKFIDGVDGTVTLSGVLRE
jgi:uncharacterized Zn finger protein